MVRRLRRSRRGSFRGFTRRGGSKRKGLGSNTNELIGAGLYSAIGEPLLDQLAGRVGLGLSDDLVKGVVGYIVSKRTSGIIRGMANAAVIISAYKFGKTGLSGIGRIFGGSSTVQPLSSNGNDFILA